MRAGGPRVEVVADDLGFAEGPVWLGDGRVAVTSVDRGHVLVVDVDAGTSRVLADLGGGPNGAASAAAGGLLVTQNGGFDFGLVPEVVDPAPTRPVMPGLWLVDAAGDSRALPVGGAVSPNDVVVDDDGVAWFTDPPRLPRAPGSSGRVWRLEPGGDGGPVVHDFWFCNGITLDVDGSLIVVERRSLVRIPAGPKARPVRVAELETVVDDLGPGGGDGLCVDVEGRIYVAATTAGSVRVHHGGRVVDEIAIPGARLVTNCCFGGDSGSTLFVTVGVPGALYAVGPMHAPGRPLGSWSGGEKPAGPR